MDPIIRDGSQTCTVKKRSGSRIKIWALERTVQASARKVRRCGANDLEVKEKKKKETNKNI